MKILKYPLNKESLQVISMPRKAKILTVQVQHNQLQLWALINQQTEEYEDRKIAIYATGAIIPGIPGEYIATVQLHEGTLLYHIFEMHDA